MDSKDNWSLLEKGVVKLDPKKISLPSELTLQNLPEIEVSLYQLSKSYFQINIEGNSIIKGRERSVVGAENAREIF